MRNLVASIALASSLFPLAARADTGLPSHAVLRSIATASQAKSESIYQTDGMKGLINAVRGCYAKLTPQSAPTARAQCLSLDLAAFYLEDGQPADYKRMDLRLDDYLSKQKFMGRLDMYMPPVPNTPANKSQKIANFHELAQAYSEH